MIESDFRPMNPNETMSDYLKAKRGDGRWYWPGMTEHDDTNPDLASAERDAVADEVESFDDFLDLGDLTLLMEQK